MIELVFESHATTFDNQQKIASGHFDVGLSPTGIKQAVALGKRRASDKFDAIFTSDLQRAYNTAKLAFEDKFSIIQDARLRECNYGDFEHQPSSLIETERIKRIKLPFPNGESYEQRTGYIKKFLQELLTKYDGKRILIIGHRATQYGIEQWTSEKSLQDIVTAFWQWQPGWTYQLDANKF